jgi:hypothetical protein
VQPHAGAFKDSEQSWAPVFVEDNLAASTGGERDTSVVER